MQFTLMNTKCDRLFSCLKTSSFISDDDLLQLVYIPKHSVPILSGERYQNHPTAFSLFKNKAFVGLGSCSNVQIERKICKLAKASNKKTQSVQLVCKAGRSSWSVQLVHPAGLSGRPIYTLHQTHCILHVASYMLHLTCCILHITSYTLHLTRCILHIASYSLHLTCCILHVTSFTLHLTHCILHIALYNLHFTHCILQFASQALNLTGASYTLHKSLKSLFQKSLKNLSEKSFRHKLKNLSK